ncbi:ABC transporter ATP-binding protein [Actinomyces vulturis]|uniref:ABC transporter ATP-binding protein n=1 Tax=Actinomyces vulturis TaxID=1857645 RepID=UPI000835A49D|nr:ABC transporter ATP-binding protein [Actinomyces vulturis]
MNSSTPTSGLSVQHLTKNYSRGNVTVPALRGVNLALPQGTQLAIMGPSGCGKTTLLHCLAGVIRPTSGSIRLNGTELTGMKESRLSALRLSHYGFVFQDGNLLPELSCEENVALTVMLGGTGRREAIEHARRLLDSLGLAGMAGARPGQLSGGQIQRVAIARALIHQPRVVFADEPTGALDQQTSHEVMGVLSGACRQWGASLVVVTHDKAVASHLPHTAHMRDGLIERIDSSSPAALEGATA